MVVSDDSRIRTADLLKLPESFIVGDKVYHGGTYIGTVESRDLLGRSVVVHDGTAERVEIRPVGQPIYINERGERIAFDGTVLQKGQLHDHDFCRVNKLPRQ
jgi:hypothetical protein